MSTSNSERDMLLAAMENCADVVATYVGVRQQFEDAGWPRDLANQMVADLMAAAHRHGRA